MQVSESAASYYSTEQEMFSSAYKLQNNRANESLFLATFQTQTFCFSPFAFIHSTSTLFSEWLRGADHLLNATDRRE